MACHVKEKSSVRSFSIFVLLRLKDLRNLLSWNNICAAVARLSFWPKGERRFSKKETSYEKHESRIFYICWDVYVACSESLVSYCKSIVFLTF